MVRDRLGLDVHLPARGARPRAGEEGRADAAFHRGETRGGLGDPAGGDHAPLRRAREIRQVAQAHLYRGARQAAPARAARRARSEEPEGLAPPRRKIAVRDRAREPQAGTGEIARAAHRVLDARGARVPVGTLECLPRAARSAAAGLVPPRRSERHPPARRILAPAAPLRLGRFNPAEAGGHEKPARKAGFLFRSAPAHFRVAYAALVGFGGAIYSKKGGVG